MNESSFEKLRKHREEMERGAIEAREKLLDMEREKKREAERRHRELVESIKNNGGVYITSGRDTNVSNSNIAGGRLKEKKKTNQSTNHPEKNWLSKSHSGKL